MASKSKHTGYIPLTRELCFAAGHTKIDIRKQHVAERHKKWTEQDRADAAARTNALLLYVPASEGGLSGFPFTHAMMEDLGLTAEQVVRSGNRILGHNGGPALDAA